MAVAADDDVEVSDDDEDGDGPADLQADIMEIAEITDAASASKIMKLRLTDATRKIYAFVFPAKAYEQRQNEEIRCLSSKTLSLVLGCGTCDRTVLPLKHPNGDQVNPATRERWDGPQNRCFFPHSLESDIVLLFLASEVNKAKPDKKGPNFLHSLISRKQIE